MSAEFSSRNHAEHLRELEGFDDDQSFYQTDAAPDDEEFDDFRELPYDLQYARVITDHLAEHHPELAGKHRDVDFLRQASHEETTELFTAVNELITTYPEHRAYEMTETFARQTIQPFLEHFRDRLADPQDPITDGFGDYRRSIAKRGVHHAAERFMDNIGEPDSQPEIAASAFRDFVAWTEAQDLDPQLEQQHASGYLRNVMHQGEEEFQRYASQHHPNAQHYTETLRAESTPDYADPRTEFNELNVEETLNHTDYLTRQLVTALQGQPAYHSTDDDTPEFPDADASPEELEEYLHQLLIKFPAISEDWPNASLEASAHANLAIEDPAWTDTAREHTALLHSLAYGAGSAPEEFPNSLRHLSFMRLSEHLSEQDHQDLVDAASDRLDHTPVWLTDDTEGITALYHAASDDNYSMTWQNRRQNAHDFAETLAQPTNHLVESLAQFSPEDDQTAHALTSLTEALQQVSQYAQGGISGTVAYHEPINFRKFIDHLQNCHQVAENTLHQLETGECDADSLTEAATALYRPEPFSQSDPSQHNELIVNAYVAQGEDPYYPREHANRFAEDLLRRHTSHVVITSSVLATEAENHIRASRAEGQTSFRHPYDHHNYDLAPENPLLDFIAQHGEEWQTLYRQTQNIAEHAARASQRLASHALQNHDPAMLEVSRRIAADASAFSASIYSQEGACEQILAEFPTHNGETGWAPDLQEPGQLADFRISYLQALEDHFLKPDDPRATRVAFAKYAAEFIIQEDNHEVESLAHVAAREHGYFEKVPMDTALQRCIEAGINHVSDEAVEALTNHSPEYLSQAYQSLQDIQQCSLAVPYVVSHLSDQHQWPPPVDDELLLQHAAAHTGDGPRIYRDTITNWMQRQLDRSGDYEGMVATCGPLRQPGAVELCVALATSSPHWQEFQRRTRERDFPDW